MARPFAFPAAFFALILTALLSLPVPAQAEYGINDMFRNAIEKLRGSKEEVAESTSEADDATRVPASRAEIQLSFAPVVKRVAVSVVNVYGTSNRQFRSPFAGDPFFERFFGQPQQRRQQSSLGSGVIVSTDGVVLTNNHVIEGKENIKVSTSDGREFESEVVLRDKKSDLAVLRIDSDETFTPIDIGDSDDIEVGDLVLAIGNPFGVGQTVTSGIISAVSRSLAGISDYGFFIQTDAAINPGNSGGALVDMNGRLIGINTAIYSRSGGSVGLGYAIPSNMTRVILNSAEKGGRVTRPWIGASFRNVDSEIADSLGMDKPGGALITKVSRDGPVEKAGLRLGDVVLSVDGRAVSSPDTLGYRLETAGVGKTVTLSVLSRGEQREVKVALMAPPETVARDETSLPEESVLWGARVANLSPAVAQEVGLDDTDKEGVIVLKVARNSPAAFNGMRPGDIVRQVNGRDVEDAKSLVSLTSRRSRAWQFVVERGDNTYIFERDGGFFRQFVR